MKSNLLQLIPFVPRTRMLNHIFESMRATLPFGLFGLWFATWIVHLCQVRLNILLPILKVRFKEPVDDGLVTSCSQLLIITETLVG
jgi:hypothetical protein